MPFDFQKIAKFRLARGMHKQPNKDGNICVNEAAVIAAGFEYRAVKDVSCLPDCFSRPISDYAIYLNDLMLHRVRNEFLILFVTRLPGTSDSPWIEAERAEFIVIETTRRIVAAEYEEVWHKPAVAAKCRTVRSLRQVSSVMAKARAVLPLECAREVLHASRRCLYRDFRIGSPCAAAAKAAARSFRNKLGPDMDRKIWEMAVAILDEAILLGRHDGIDDHTAAAEWLERAKMTPIPAEG
ncbi:MAG TPA: hypothetical protein VJ770_03515 [Stellaceae bacterium]|nr:hypothetical protein [Stellaceae bacterium]